MKIKKVLSAAMLLAGLTFFGCNLGCSIDKKHYYNVSLDRTISSKDVFTRVERIEKYLDKQGFSVKKKMYSIDYKTCDITYENDNIYFNIKVKGFEDESKKDKRWAIIYIEGKDADFDYNTLEEGVCGLLQGDFVKIRGAKFDPGEQKEKIFRVELEGSDGEGINWFTYILDGKILGKMRPGAVDKNPYRLEKTEFMFGVPITKEKDSCWWKYKGHHNLKVIMEDNNGNKLEDVYWFTVQ